MISKLQVTEVYNLRWQHKK